MFKIINSFNISSNARRIVKIHEKGAILCMCLCEKVKTMKIEWVKLRPIQYNKLSFHYFINPQCVNVFVYILLKCYFACIIHIEDRTLNCVRWGNAFPSFPLHPFFTFVFHFGYDYVFDSLFLVYLYPIR